MHGVYEKELWYFGQKYFRIPHLICLGVGMAAYLAKSHGRQTPSYKEVGTSLSHS